MTNWSFHFMYLTFSDYMTSKRLAKDAVLYYEVSSTYKGGGRVYWEDRCCWIGGWWVKKVLHWFIN